MPNLGRKGKAIERSVSPKKDQKVFSTLQFEVLPNEVVVQVFSYLKIEDILKCGKVSKRFKAISNNENLWPKQFNLYFKKVPLGFLQKLLDSGCKYLNLSRAILEGTLNLSRASRLLYLNLSRFPKRENSEKLVESCYSLQKLSLSYSRLSSKLISSASLQNGKTLRVLDLSNCTFCEIFDHANSGCLPNCANTVSIRQIVENCTELTELSLHETKLCEKSVDILCFNLTSKIEKLDLFDMSFLLDEHVKELVTRCKKITELDLGGWNTLITVQSLNFITEHLKLTLVKLNLQQTHIILRKSDFLKLKSMEKLTHLCYNNNDRSISKWLKKQLPSLWIHFGNPTIATPCHTEYEQGVWEIKVEREDLF